MRRSGGIWSCCCCWRSCFFESLYISKDPRMGTFFLFLSAAIFFEDAFKRCKVLPFFSVGHKDMLAIRQTKTTYALDMAST